MKIFNCGFDWVTVSHKPWAALERRERNERELMSHLHTLLSDVFGTQYQYRTLPSMSEKPISPRHAVGIILNEREDACLYRKAAMHGDLLYQMHGMAYGSQFWAEILLDNYTKAKLGKTALNRVDFAFDIETELDVWGIYESINVEERRKLKYFPSASGNTFYIGNRKSDVYIRLYDKLIKTQFAGERQVVRVEIEYKCPKRMHQVASRAGAAGVRDYLIKALCRRLRGIGLQALASKIYEHPIDKDDRYYIEPVRGVGTTEQWLERQVLPALDKMLYNDYNTFIDFLKRVQGLKEKYDIEYGSFSESSDSNQDWE